MCIMQAAESSQSHACRDDNSAPFHDKSTQDCQFISETPIWMEMFR